MTLMIGTSELAERLYVAYRERMEFVAPLTSQDSYDGRLKPRPNWAHLSPRQQQVWKHVAEVAAGVLVDAMGAA